MKSLIALLGIIFFFCAFEYVFYAFDHMKTYYHLIDIGLWLASASCLAYGFDY